MTELPTLSRDKAYTLYKQQLERQFVLYYFNVGVLSSAYASTTLYNHTNMGTCDCSHCAISHVHKIANMYSIYCRYCCNR